MFNLPHRLSPDQSIEYLFEANKRDHQRPPHPWDALFRNGECTKEQLQGCANLLHQAGADKEYSILYNCLPGSVHGHDHKIASEFC